MFLKLMASLSLSMNISQEDLGRDPLMALGGQLTKFSGEIGPTI